MVELLNYDTSWLNPALKFFIVGLYLVVAFIYFRSRAVYAGDLHRVLSVLLWMATIAALASLFRYFGHGTMFGFTKQFSLKWFQGLGFLVQAILLIVGGVLFRKGVIPELRD